MADREELKGRDESGREQNEPTTGKSGSSTPGAGSSGGSSTPGRSSNEPGRQGQGGAGGQGGQSGQGSGQPSRRPGTGSEEEESS